MRRFSLCVAVASAILAIILVGGFAAGLSAQGVVPWQRYDVNQDRRFDGADVRQITREGLHQPAVDGNGDGKKNVLDSYQIMVDLTRWDRNADGAVDASDQRIFAPVALPVPDSTAAAAVAQRVLTQYGARQQTLEARLRASWQDRPVADPDSLEKLYNHAGAEALLNRNLEAALVLYARALEARPASEWSLASLAFVLIEADSLHAAARVLARARQLSPDACPVNANLGALHARFGRPDQARPFYEAALRGCPNAQQYRLNLAATLLRLGLRANAEKLVEQVARNNPNDAEAVLLATALTPPVQIPQALSSEYERLRQTSDAWKDRAPWTNLDAQQRAEVLLEVAEEPAYRELDRIRGALADRVHAEIRKSAETALPDGKSMCADLERWGKNWGPAVHEIRDIKAAALKEYRDAQVATARRAAGARLSIGPLLLELARQQAALNMVHGRHAYDQTIETMYELPMRDAEQQMRNPIAYVLGDDLDPDPDKLEEAVTLAFVAITAGAMDPKYLGDGKCASNAEPPKPAELPGASAIGVNVGIIGVEITPRTCDLKIQVGQGLFAAGTWSPINGFGFQAGVGVRGTMGPLKLNAAHYLKFGSDGSVSENTSLTAGAEGLHAKYRYVSKDLLVPAQHESTGASAYLTEFLGCKQ